ncbi:MAG TPA: hypothetical protein ENG80_02675 [Nitrospirae bacterium]|nr:hypothetical protein [Nitrospirota bacterium]
MMMRLRKNLILLIVVSLPLFLMACNKYKEEAPFFDGLFLEYSSSGIPVTYEVSVTDNNEFKITETKKHKVFDDEIELYHVDAQGIVVKGSWKESEGYFSPIWIPINEMEVGDTFKYNGGDKYKIVKKDRWKKWNVLVIKGMTLGEERYFDLNTGFWVGLHGKGMGRAVTIVLTDTNADIPTVEE